MIITHLHHQYCGKQEDVVLPTTDTMDYIVHTTRYVDEEDVHMGDGVFHLEDDGTLTVDIGIDPPIKIDLPGRAEKIVGHANSVYVLLDGRRVYKNYNYDIYLFHRVATIPTNVIDISVVEPWNIMIISTDDGSLYNEFGIRIYPSMHHHVIEHLSSGVMGDKKIVNTEITIL